MPLKANELSSFPVAGAVSRRAAQVRVEVQARSV